MPTTTLEPTQTTTKATKINGINTDDVRALVKTVAADPVQGQTRWAVTTRWRGGTVSESRVRGFQMGGRWIERPFTIVSDEPLELGGTNTYANPQEYLLASLNACMTVGYVVGASMAGVELESLEIETSGNIDLRGFLQIDPTVPNGYPGLHYKVRIKGNGTREQMRKIHETVIATSPNRFNLATPIRLTADLEVL